MRIFLLTWTDDPRGHTDAVFFAPSLQALEPMFIEWYNRKKADLGTDGDFELSAEGRWKSLIEDREYRSIMEGSAEDGFVFMKQSTCS